VRRGGTAALGKNWHPLLNGNRIWQDGEEFPHPARSNHVNTDSEWELIARCRQGNTLAFEPLVRSHEGRALAVAEGLLGDADDAADAVQDAFVKAYGSLGRLREGSSFGPWFRTIVRNLCLDRLRSPRRREVKLSHPGVERGAWIEQPAPAQLQREQAGALIRAALAELAPEHRQILVLREMEELSYAEIAEAAGIPAGTVASRLHNARLAMRELLIARGITMEEVS
jgi:RNA polymerase sigma-70 factor, ECF subfamily